MRARFILRKKDSVIASCQSRHVLVCSLGIALLLVTWLSGGAAQATLIQIQTVTGSFSLRLYDTAMPRTVANFLHYVTSNKYAGTVIHRNSDTPDPPPSGPLRDFVIQGGGYTLTDPIPPNDLMSVGNVATIAPIADEPGGGVTGLSNLRGTIAMAKSGPNTATSQWFINQGDNSFLDDPARSDGGFAAFGRVLAKGMTVVDAIGDLPIPSDFGFEIGGAFNDLPLRNFSGDSIEQVRVQNTVTVTRVRVLNYPMGDYDFNGTVDAADYIVWKSTFGSTTNAAADGNGDGIVNAADYSIWRNTFGQISAPGGGAGGFETGSVPEPHSLMLAAMAGGCSILASRRRNAFR